MRYRLLPTAHGPSPRTVPVDTTCSVDTGTEYVHNTGMMEREVQRQIIDGLRARGADVIVTHDAKHRPVTLGVSDLIAVLDGSVLFIEVKGEDGVASEDQRSFLGRMKAKGHTAIIACSWDDVERYL